VLPSPRTVRPCGQAAHDQANSLDARLLRAADDLEPAGEWNCLDAQTAISTGGGGLATSCFPTVTAQWASVPSACSSRPGPAWAGQEAESHRYAEAILAPSAWDRNFAHVTVGTTTSIPAAVPNPQSVPAITFSRPTTSA
jgi:hypothetical protein